jgi:hypothetical protein
MVSIDKTCFKLFRKRALSKSVHVFRPCPVRGLKVLGEPCFYYLNTIVSFKHGIKIGLRHGLMWLLEAETEISL